MQRGVSYQKLLDGLQQRTWNLPFYRQQNTIASGGRHSFAITGHRFTQNETINFDDAEKACQSKTTLELLRSSLILNACSVETFVKHNYKVSILDFKQNPLKERYNVHVLLIKFRNVNNLIWLNDNHIVKVILEYFVILKSQNSKPTCTCIPHTPTPFRKKKNYFRAALYIKISKNWFTYSTYDTSIYLVFENVHLNQVTWHTYTTTNNFKVNNRRWITLLQTLFK